MILDYKKINDLNRYKIMSDTVIPRPIAWTVTQDDGIINAAPFSYFIPISTNPALVIIAIGKKENGDPKDSLANILKNKKTTICFANKDNVNKVQKCAYALDKNESEIEKFDIDVEIKLDEYPPMISSSQSALFCEYYDTVDIPGDTTPIILKINHQYIENGRLDEKNHVQVDNVGRCGVSFKALVDIEI